MEIIRRGVPAILPKEATLEQGCLYHAEATRQILAGVIESDKFRKPGQPKSRVIIQAGSASWMKIKPEEDDGKMNTHFSYEWQGGSAELNMLRIGLGDMPEMHVWNAIVTPGHPSQIIDITTRYLKTRCCALIGDKWTAEEPPDFIWCLGAEIPPTTIYAADAEATRLAYMVLGQTVDTVLKPEYR